MKDAVTVYLGIDNYLIRKGFEDLLTSKFNAEITTISCIKEIDALKANGNGLNKYQPELLVYNLNLTKLRSELKALFNLLKNYENLRPIIISGEFDYRNIKTLFGLGVYAVVSTDLNYEELIHVLRRVVDNDHATCEK